MLCYTEQKNISCYSSLDHPGTPIQQLTVLQKMRKIEQRKYVVTSSCCLFLLRYIRLNVMFFCNFFKHEFYSVLLEVTFLFFFFLLLLLLTLHEISLYFTLITQNILKFKILSLCLSLSLY